MNNNLINIIYHKILCKYRHKHEWNFVIENYDENLAYHQCVWCNIKEYQNPAVFKVIANTVSLLIDMVLPENIIRKKL